MIQIGGTVNISLKKNKLVFGKSNRSGKAEKQVRTTPVLFNTASAYQGMFKREIEATN